MTATQDLQTRLDAELQQWQHSPLEADGPVRIEARPMFGAQAYLARGKLFAAVGPMGLLLKLPEERRGQLAAAGVAGPFSIQPGVAFGEWVAVPPAGWDALGWDALLGLVRESFRYTLTAAPKPRPPRERRHFRKRMY